MRRLLFCRSLNNVGKIVPLAHAASLAGEAPHNLGCAVRQDGERRIVRAPEPSFNGGAASAGDVAQRFDGFDRVGEAGEVTKRKGWWVCFFGARCGPDAI